MRLPSTAVMAGLRVIDGVKLLGLDAGIGITSGRVWCGVSSRCVGVVCLPRRGAAHVSRF